jgi:hypothetical protein
MVYLHPIEMQAVRDQDVCIVKIVPSMKWYNVHWLYNTDKFLDEPTTSRIVLELVDPFLDKGYTVYLDSWYTNPDLVDKLCQRKAVCTRESEDGKTEVV